MYEYPSMGDRQDGEYECSSQRELGTYTQITLRSEVDASVECVVLFCFYTRFSRCHTRDTHSTAVTQQPAPRRLRSKSTATAVAASCRRSSRWRSVGRPCGQFHGCSRLASWRTRAVMRRAGTANIARDARCLGEQRDELVHV